jgi:hypothetical protein
MCIRIRMSMKKCQRNFERCEIGKRGDEPERDRDEGDTERLGMLVHAPFDIARNSAGAFYRRKVSICIYIGIVVPANHPKSRRRGRTGKERKKGTHHRERQTLDDDKTPSPSPSKKTNTSTSIFTHQKQGFFFQKKKVRLTRCFSPPLNTSRHSLRVNHPPSLSGKYPKLTASKIARSSPVPRPLSTNSAYESG